MPLNRWYIRQNVKAIKANLPNGEAKHLPVAANACSPMDSAAKTHKSAKLPNARTTPVARCMIDIIEVICGR